MIAIPDVVIGLLFELAHLLFEVVFISFEWLESLLDHLVEHLLHTELHETQTIVFYLLVSIAVLPLYYLWRLLRRLFFWLKESLLTAWVVYKNHTIVYWQNLSLIDKIKVLVIAAGAIYLASFIFM
jgi:hypothetical protein